MSRAYTGALSYPQKIVIILLNKISSQHLKGDIFGGLTAAVIALPLALAFGVSSGAGAIAGVYGAIFVGFFAALFGGTATQISGPTGPMSVVMALVFTQLIGSHPDTGLVLAFTCVILAGLFQILFGLLKLGKYFVMVPYPVISGFMTGIGIIIILLQISPLLGSAGDSNALAALMNIPNALSQQNTLATVLGVITLLFMIYWPEKWTKIIPAPLFALITLTVISATFFSQQGISVIGEIPTGFPSLSMPSLSLESLSQVSYFAFLLAVLGAIDSLLTSMVADTLTETHHDSDKELIGQGIANTIAGFFGALPGAGATMRTAINIRAGGKTALSGIIHSITLLIVILWAGDYAQYIPHTVLAGMLIKVGLDIIDWRFIFQIKKVGLFSAALMLLVLLLTVFVDLITAVLVGMFIANLVTLDRLTHIQLDNITFKRGDELLSEISSETMIEVNSEMTSNETNSALTDDIQNNLSKSLANTLLLEIDGPVSFAVSRELSRRFTENLAFTTLVIDLSNAKLIGTTTAIMITDLIDRTKSKDKTVLVITGNEKINQSLDKLSLATLLDKKYQFTNREQALQTLI
ncbi:SulP family inorganic anion transporter [Colwellia sp. Bg11-28]|uniref:SulP family inorganic anion transporter n=1 Tax=Colwellia sp. Bg11-28 TaxID=2058305 RepID=UPI000C33F47C|nr:SulP family inorganic anion transporter [Colwellia sp. Bg11-28]PKH85140.1 sodium-independent anion transporter [Colwellia sp. Bg11-28]